MGLFSRKPDRDECEHPEATVHTGRPRVTFEPEQTNTSYEGPFKMIRYYNTWRNCNRCGKTLNSETIVTHELEFTEVDH